MTATFDKNGIRFIYPETWSLAEFGDSQEFREVSLESPEGSIWSVSIFPGATPAKQVIETCLDALKQQYDDLESFDFAGDYNGFAATGFDADFYCLDFLVTAQTRTFEHNGQVFSFFCQAESREFEKNREVFNALTLSLMNNES